jgi:hypothetical protein
MSTTTIDPTTAETIAKVLADYDEWREDRADLSAGDSSGNLPASGDWHDSDDTGCGLADRMAELLRPLAAEPEEVAGFRVGMRVRTTDHGFVGTVKKLHLTCPMGPAQIMGQSIPLDDAALAAPWLTVHPDTGGSMMCPTTRATILDPDLTPVTVCATCEDYVDDPRLRPATPADDDPLELGWVHIENGEGRCPGQGDDDTDDYAEPRETTMDDAFPEGLPA